MDASEREGEDRNSPKPHSREESLPKASDYIVSDNSSMEKTRTGVETALSNRDPFHEKMELLFQWSSQYQALLKKLEFTVALVLINDEVHMYPERWGGKWPGILREKYVLKTLEPYLGDNIESKVHDGLERLADYLDLQEKKRFSFFKLRRDGSESVLKDDLAKLLKKMLDLLE